MSHHTNFTRSTKQLLSYVENPWIEVVKVDKFDAFDRSGSQPLIIKLGTPFNGLAKA